MYQAKVIKLVLDFILIVPALFGYVKNILRKMGEENIRAQVKKYKKEKDPEKAAKIIDDLFND